MERNDLTFNKNIWEVTKTQQNIWQNLLEYAKFTFMARKDADRINIYDDATGKYYMVLGGNRLPTIEITLGPCIGTLKRLRWG